MPTAMATIEHATQLLDFSQKLDITLLDSVVSCFYMAHGPQVDKFFRLFSSYCSCRLHLKANLTEIFFFLSKATNGRPNPNSTEAAPRRLDSSGYYSRIFKQPTDKGKLVMLHPQLHFSKTNFYFYKYTSFVFFVVFCAPNTRSSHKDTMESSPG